MPYEEDLNDKAALARRFGVSEKEIKLYLDTYNMLDENKDGLITPSELHNALRALGHQTTLDEARAMVHMVDENEDGMVDITEYLSMIFHTKLHHSKPNVEQESLAAFKLFDKNKDGYITLDELRHFMSKFGQSLTSKEARALLEMMDINGDGRISYIEFIAYWAEFWSNGGSSG